MSAEKLHQAYWLLKQLHMRLSPPEALINIRCILNEEPRKNPETGKTEHPTKVTFDQFFQIKDMRRVWYESLLNQLIQLNHAQGRPSNIYFAVNALRQQGHKKDYFLHFGCLFLDLDDNKNYTKEQRWMQIRYWIALGFAPSIVVDSGHGYHVYWILTRPLSKEEGEALLKRMVALADCREGGNTFDISRVFRLPGFLNVKEWYSNDTPPCGIVWPENYEQIEEAFGYDPSYLENFPPSSLKALERYYNEAQRMSGNAEEFKLNVEKLLSAAREAHANLTAQQQGQRIATQNQAEARTEDPTAWEPSLNVCPPVDEIKWGRANGWMKKYCKLGHVGMNAGDLDELKMEQKFSDTSASALDFQVIYVLVKKGYTREAIREFWKRPETKLFRADKEQKNANYFDMSFDKALDYVRAIRQQKEAGAGEKKSIEVLEDHFTTFVKSSDGKTEPCLTGELTLKAIYEDQNATLQNEKQLYDISAKCQNAVDPEGFVKTELFIPNSAFDSVQTFKKHVSSGVLRVTTNNNANLSKIAHHLLHKFANAPRHTFHSKVIYKDRKFIFPTFVIGADKITQTESLPMMEELSKKFPMFGQFDVKFLPQDMILRQLQEHWGRMLRMHLPRVVTSIIGIITASALKPIFEDDLGIAQYHLPTINVRGASHTAKTETIKKLCTIMGVKEGKNVVSLGSSEFALSRYLASTNFIPILIDEFKIEGWNQKHIDQLRQLVRRTYSGESLLRGRQDMSIYHMETHAGMVVAGESALERPGEISIITRCIPINTDTFDPASHRENYVALRHVTWQELAPYFYSFLLRQNAQSLFAEMEKLEDNIFNMLADHYGPERSRVAHNLATVWFGCRVFDRFIKSMDPTLPTIEEVCAPKKALVDYLCEWADEEEHALKIKETVIVNGEKRESTRVISSNEFFTMLKTYGMMIQTRNGEIMRRNKDMQFIYEEDKINDSLKINLQVMHEAFSAYTFATSKMTPDSVGKMRSLAKAAAAKREPWIKELSTVIWTKERGAQRVMVLNLSLLRVMKIWPEEKLLIPMSDWHDARVEEEKNGQQATPKTGL
jgi:hypothetical protein